MAPARHAGQGYARPDNHGSSTDLRAGGWRWRGTRFRTDARPEKIGSSADLRAGGWRRHGARSGLMLGRTAADQARTFAPLDGAGTTRRSGLCSAGQPRIKRGPSRPGWRRHDTQVRAMLGRRTTDQARTFAPPGWRRQGTRFQDGCSARQPRIKRGPSRRADAAGTAGGSGLMLGRTATDQAQTFAPVDGAGTARGSGLMLGRTVTDQMRARTC
jgi:hypothetical protein